MILYCRKSWILLLLFFGATTSAKSQYLMIAHPEFPYLKTNAAELRRIYLGEMTEWKGHYKVVPVNQKKGQDERQGFFYKILKMTEKEYTRHWQQMEKEQRIKPPAEFANCAEVVAYIKKNKHAIGYINAACPHEGVKVLFVNRSEVW